MADIGDARDCAADGLPVIRRDTLQGGAVLALVPIAGNGPAEAQAPLAGRPARESHRLRLRTTVNDADVDVEIYARTSLLDPLREHAARIGPVAVFRTPGLQPTNFFNQRLV